MKTLGIILIAPLLITLVVSAVGMFVVPWILIIAGESGWWPEAIGSAVVFLAIIGVCLYEK